MEPFNGRFRPPSPQRHMPWPDMLHPVPRRFAAMFAAHRAPVFHNFPHRVSLPEERIGALQNRP